MFLKQTILLLNVIGLLIYKLFFVNEVIVNINAPANSRVGKEFTVEINIVKGANTGFAKIQQELPPGCNAIIEDAAGGNFSFINGVVKIIWMNLPPSESLKVVYTIAIDETASISQIPLAGKFTYVENNEKISYNIPTSTVVIMANTIANEDVTTNVTKVDTLTPETTVESNLTNQNTKEINALGNESNISVTRKVVMNASNEFTVELTVNKTGISGFSKIEEILPDGLTATNIESVGGVFSYVDNKVKIIWINLPSANEFKISYKVSVNPSYAESKVSISGILSFLENDETKKAEIPTSTVTLELDKSEEVVSTADNTSNEGAREMGNSVQPVIPTQVTNNNYGGGLVSTAEGNVVFKVQICATHKSVPNTYFKNNWSVADEIESEQHEGWYKYTTGKYNQYSQARDKRVELTANTKIPSPFVTAYNGANRITVQEGLMISRQSWIK